MHKKYLKRAGLIGIVSFGFIGFIVMIPKYMRPKQKMNFKLAEVHSADYPTSIANQYFADLVKERTDGKIEITVYTDGILGEETEVIKEIQNGEIAFGRVSIAPLAEYVDELNALMLPYLYEDGAHMWRVLESTIGENMLSALEEAHLKGLTWYDSGARSFYFTKEITKIEDFEKLNIRVQKNSLMYTLCEALGAKPKFLSEGDTYLEMLNGSLDGAENNIPTYENYKHYEVGDYYILDEHTRIPDLLVASSEVMKSLSKQQQQIILEAAKEAGEYEYTLWQERETVAMQRLQNKGVNFVRLSENTKVELKAACESLYNLFGSAYSETLEQIESLAIK